MWAPVILETEAEWDFIRAADMYITRENWYPYYNELYWIGGTTSDRSVLQSEYSDYIPDAGNMIFEQRNEKKKMYRF